MTTSRGLLLGEATLPRADREFRADLLHWTACQLPGCTSGAIREAAIVLGELLTNAYSHGKPPFRVSISARRRGHLLRLAVEDSATAPHTPWLPGKGLFVVRGLCRKWGVAPGSTGKTVWAELAMLVPPDDDGGNRRRADERGAERDRAEDGAEDGHPEDDPELEPGDGDPAGAGDQRGFEVPGPGQPIVGMNRGGR